MTYIYNATDEMFLSLEDYFAEIVTSESDSYFVVFLVDIEDLFVAVKKKTALRGRFAKGPNGEPLLDKIAITDDERDLFDDTLLRGAPEVFTKLAAWAKLVDQAYKHDVTFGDDLVTKYIIYSVSMDLNWDINMLQGVDNAIWNALIAYLVKTWYYLNRYAEDYAAEEIEYQNETTKIRSQLMHTKAPIRRPADMLTDASRSITLTSIPTSGTSPAPTPATEYEFRTGILAPFTPKTVVHDQGWATYSIRVFDVDGVTEVGADVIPTVGNETNAVTVEIGVYIGDPGLLIRITRVS